MNRFEDMVVKNDEEEIPISDELVQEQILTMLHLHFRLSIAMLVILNVKSLNLKPSKAMHQQGQKRQKWKARKKQKIRKIIPGGVGSMTETLISISQKEVWSKSLVHQVLYSFLGCP
jgi:hypothetical protein